MTIPAEMAWIIPFVVPLLIGLLAGVIVKHSVKLIFLIAALVAILVMMGYVSFKFQDVIDKAMLYLLKIIGTGSELIKVLPYSSTTFIIGLALGLWKG